MNAFRKLIGPGRPTYGQAAQAIEWAKLQGFVWADGPMTLIVPTGDGGLAWGVFGITLDDGESIAYGLEVVPV